jgi:hypothetical protein
MNFRQLANLPSPRSGGHLADFVCEFFLFDFLFTVKIGEH